MTDREPDPELRERLLAADPASSLPAADPDRVADLLEAVMSDTATRTHESRETGTHDRSPLTWLVAAAAVVLIVGAGLIGLAQRGDDSSPTVQQSVTRLGIAPAPGRCAIPSPGVLRQQSVAFDATLASVTGATATFDVSHWYAGGPTDVVEVSLSANGISELVQAADLKVGSDYLVAASDGVVTGCGYTGPTSPDLQRLYAGAFG